MAWRLGLRFSLALLLLSLASFPLVHSARATPVSVTVSPDHVTISFQLDMSENLTALPPLNVSLVHSTSPTIVGPLNAAIQKLSPNAKVDDLSLSARTFNVSGVPHLQENYTIVVAGANSNSGSEVTVDLAFLSMNVSQPVTVGNVELSQVGTAYLLNPLTAFAQLAAEENLKVGWYIDGSKTLTPSIPEITTRGFRLLDFSWVPTISHWDSQQDLLGQSTHWNYSVPFPRFNLTYGPISPELTLLKSYVAVFDPSFEMSVSYNAFTNGSQIQFDLPAQAESIMPILVIVSIIGLLTVLVLDRRLSKPRITRKKKR